MRALFVKGCQAELTSVTTNNRLLLPRVSDELFKLLAHDVAADSGSTAIHFGSESDRIIVETRSENSGGSNKTSVLVLSRGANKERETHFCNRLFPPKGRETRIS